MLYVYQVGGLIFGRESDTPHTHATYVHDNQLTWIYPVAWHPTAADAEEFAASEELAYIKAVLHVRNSGIALTQTLKTDQWTPKMFHPKS